MQRYTALSLQQVQSIPSQYGTQKLSLSQPLIREDLAPLMLFNEQTKQLEIQEEGLKIIEGIGRTNIGVMVIGYSSPELLQKEAILKQIFQVKGKELIVLCGAPGLWIVKKPLINVDSDGNQLIVIGVVMTVGLVNNEKIENESLVCLLRLASQMVWVSKGLMVEELSSLLGKLINGGQKEESDTGLLWVEVVEGCAIEGKERLDKALGLLNGFSDQIEERNRVRRAIMAIFKERDCVGASESIMQMPGMIQVLKKRIFNKVKGKFVNNNAINGEILASVLRAGIGRNINLDKSINNILKNDAQKVLTEAYNIYEMKAQELGAHKIPCLIEELKAFHKIAKEKSQIIVKKAGLSVGFTEEILKELNKKIKGRFQSLAQENDKESYRVCISFIGQEFSTISNKQKNGEYRSFNEFERDIHLFYKYFMDNGPKTANKQLILMEYLQKAIFEGSTNFLKKMGDQVEEINLVNEEINNKFENELMEQNQIAENIKNNLIAKINQLELEKQQIQSELTSRQESQSKFENSSSETQIQLHKSLEALKKENIELKQQISDQSLSHQQLTKEIERDKQLIKGEFNKEKQLLVQKNEYYERQIEEFQRKELAIRNDKNNKEKQNIEQIKEITAKQEERVRTMQMEAQAMQETIIEYENELQTKNQQFEMEKKKINLNEGYLQNQLKQAKEQIEKLKIENKELKAQDEHASEIKLQSEKMESRNINEFKSEIEQLQITLKEKEEMIKMLKTNTETEKAIIIQKLEFSEVKLNETKKKLVDAKEAYDKMVGAFEQTNLKQCQELNSKQVQEMKTTFKNQIKTLELELSSTKFNLQKQMKDKEEKYNELDLQFKLMKGNFESQIESNKNELELREQMLQKVKESNKQMEQEKQKLLSECEQRYTLRIQNLENQLEGARNKNAFELEEQQSGAEEQLLALRRMFNEEKEKLEKRVEEEKSKQEKKLQRIIEEYELKIQEQQQVYEDEIDQLREELKDIECEKNQLFAESSADKELKSEKIVLLEQQLVELRRCQKQMEEKAVEERNANEMKVQEERVNAREAVEKVQKERDSIERQFQSMMDKSKWKDEEIVEMQTKLKEMQSKSKEKEDLLRDQFKVTQEKADGLQQELMEGRMEWDKEKALADQQRIFIEQRIKEFEEENRNLKQIYEEKMKNEKENLIKEKEKALEIMQQEMEKVQTKYEKTKNKMKEMQEEKGYNECERMKERNMEEDKQKQQEKSILELQELLTTEREKNTKLKYGIEKQFSEEKRNWENKEKEMKARIKQVEEETEHKINKFETEIALLEGRWQFAESQKDEAKEVAADLQMRLEMMTGVIERIKQKQQVEDKEKGEEEIKEKVDKEVERMKLVMDNEMERVKMELERKLKNLEKENKEINEKYKKAWSDKNKLEDNLQKVNDILRENEKKRDESRGRRREEQKEKEKAAYNAWEEEREKLKQIIQVKDNEIKQIEVKKTQSAFEVEKELAKIRIKTQNAEDKTVEWQQKFQESERKRELLLKENERLKGTASNLQMLSKKALGNSQKQLPLHNSSNSSSQSQFQNNSNANGLSDITNKQSWLKSPKFDDIFAQKNLFAEEEEENCVSIPTNK